MEGDSVTKCKLWGCVESYSDMDGDSLSVNCEGVLSPTVIWRVIV